MIFLKWEEPVEPNGLITQYEVSEMKNPKKNPKKQQQLEAASNPNPPQVSAAVFLFFFPLPVFILYTRLRFAVTTPIAGISLPTTLPLLYGLYLPPIRCPQCWEHDLQPLLAVCRTDCTAFSLCRSRVAELRGRNYFGVRGGIWGQRLITNLPERCLRKGATLSASN